MIAMGTPDNDTIDLISQAGGNVQLRQNSVDAVFARVDEIEILSGEGDDFISVNSAIPVRIAAAAGDDTIISSGSEVLVEAGDGNDVIFSTSSIGTLLAGPGRDSIFAYGGSQILMGGDGADLLLSYATKSPHLVVGGNIDIEPILALELSRRLSILATAPQVLKDLIAPLDDRTKDSIFSLGMLPSVEFAESGNFYFRRRMR